MVTMHDNAQGRRPPRAGSHAVLRRSLKPFGLLVTMYVLLGGAPYGIEEIVPMSGPGMAILVLVGMAIFWGAPYALIVSELVSALPQEGGIYQWFRAGLGPFWSFQLSYVDWLTWVLDSCLYPPLVAAYLLSFLSPGAGSWMTWSVCLAVIWVLTWLNIAGVRAVGRFSALIAALVVTPFVAMVVLAWPRLSLSHLGPLVPEGQTFGTSLSHALIWCVWTYSGYNALANAGEEIVDTERSYPRTLAIYLPVSVLGCILPLMAGLAATANWMEWKTAHFAQVALVLGGTWLAACTALAAQLAGIGTFNGELLITSRLPYAMARDGLLPRFLTGLHPRYQTPHRCLILQAILYSILTFFLSFRQLLMVSTWMALPVYILMFLTPIILRLKYPRIHGRFRIGGGWPGLLLTAFSPILIALYVLLKIEREHILRGLAFMAVGPLLYAGSAWWRRRFESVTACPP